ncbi:MAG: cytochrome c biogenesis protein [Saprospiraceae bacterium]|nr:cytochrome c biogenesis protein [Saprospiraceae bacterium]
MKQHWWKILTVILLFYVLIAGMLIPIRTGIISDAKELELTIGKKNTIFVQTYNTQYEKEEAKDIKARIRIGEKEKGNVKVINASAIEVINNRTLKVDIDLPPIPRDSLPAPMLQIGSPKNGFMFSAVSLLLNNNPDASITTNFQEIEALPEVDYLSFPFLNILEESVRNLYYHVPMWFGMMLILLISVIHSIQALRDPTNPVHDIRARAYASVGVLYGILGLVTGMLWAQYTWGWFWTWDVKQNTSAVALLIYLAYFVLRSSFDDADKRSRVAAIYNIFAFAMLIPLLYVIPRMVDSLHPGMGGNPGFNSYDLDSTMRLVFYPAVIAWIMLGIWISSLKIRLDRVEQKILDLD